MTTKADLEGALKDALKERDAYKKAKQRLADVTKERDAYKKAKKENDDRFSGERDQARADLVEYKKSSEKELNRTRTQNQSGLLAVQQERDTLRNALEAEKVTHNTTRGNLKALADLEQMTTGPLREEVLKLKKTHDDLSGQLKEAQNALAQKPWSVLAEIAMERARQDTKWGEQNHPDGTCFEGPEKAKARADAARDACEKASKAGALAWSHILTEELMEAFAESESSALRKELVQVGAVTVAWIEGIDRRASGGTPSK